MPTVLITGANRGIGLELARQYAVDGWDVIGTAREPAEAADLKAIDGVEILPLDAADDASIAGLADSLIGRPIDVFINNGGISGPRGYDREGWLELFSINTVGPYRLAHALKPNVAAGGQKKMIVISSQVGSIAETSSASMTFYRSSKAAVNMVWKSLALDFFADGFILAMLHPGWVQTDMGGSNADITVKESVSGMREVIASLTPDDTTAFKRYDGGDIPW